MRGLSLWQPWASAIAVGSKRVETRSWGTSYRGLVAIHAAKKWNKELEGDAEYFRFSGVPLPADPGDLPLGAVVAVAVLGDCRRMDEEWIREQTSIELLLGGWEPGRYGWVLSSVQALVEPESMRGKQGLWTLTDDQVASLVTFCAGGCKRWQLVRQDDKCGQRRRIGPWVCPECHRKLCGAGITEPHDCKWRDRL